MLILLHIIATAALAGLLWVVQLVVYPILRAAPEDSFHTLHELEMRRIAWVVVPLMLTELGSAIWLLATQSPYMPIAWQWAGLALIALCWAHTFLIAVPIHQRLRRHHAPRDTHRLVLTNWPRTLAWTARVALLLSAASTS